ncbi:LysM peptidoglycan-binding domain-containing protein, partial [Mycobacteroides abscessus]
GRFRVRRWAVLIGREWAFSCPPMGSFSCPSTAVGAAVATMWLLMLGQVSAAGIGGAGVPDRLAVVQVAPGETLADVASRVAPEAPRSAVVSKIRELNELDSATVQAGQTLVSPVG